MLSFFIQASLILMNAALVQAGVVSSAMESGLVRSQRNGTQRCRLFFLAFSLRAKSSPVELWDTMRFQQ